ncbi:unnamed protein product [Thelazia callipaeda]|uniref:Transmembrane protein n=1 Tax=Thelazia callipaeda TaxID=103827 RepID=A0A0N5CJ86_THECL|nr:unnamed protein product [Thelazia callipaeda]
MADLGGHMMEAVPQKDKQDNLLLRRNNFRSACKAPNVSTVGQKNLMNKKANIHALPKIGHCAKSGCSKMGDDHSIKAAANCKLPNDHTFFGTIHVKTSATMLTIIYMILVGVAGLTASTAMSDSPSFALTCAALLLIVLLAQFGIWKEASIFLLPIIVILGAAVFLSSAVTVFVEFYCMLNTKCTSMCRYPQPYYSTDYCNNYRSTAVASNGEYSVCDITLLLCSDYVTLLENDKLQQVWFIETTDDEADEDILIQNVPNDARFSYMIS